MASEPIAGLMLVYCGVYSGLFALNLLALLSAKVIRRPLIIAWVLAVVIALTVPIITGQIYGIAEAKKLLGFVQKSSLYYGSAVASSSATILALMLTILSLTGHKDEQDKETFTRLHAIGTFCVYGFIGAIVLLLFISFPVDEFDKVPSQWFSIIYYSICIWNGMLAGHMISTILILRDTATKLIGDLSPDFDEDGEETQQGKQQED